jgi:hypothetical protein
MLDGGCLATLNIKLTRLQGRRSGGIASKVPFPVEPVPLSHVENGLISYLEVS